MAVAGRGPSRYGRRQQQFVVGHLLRRRHYLRPTNGRDRRCCPRQHSRGGIRQMRSKPHAGRRRTSRRPERRQISVIENRYRDPGGLELAISPRRLAGATWLQLPERCSSRADPRGAVARCTPAGGRGAVAKQPAWTLRDDKSTTFPSRTPSGVTKRVARNNRALAQLRCSPASKKNVGVLSRTETERWRHIYYVETGLSPRSDHALLPSLGRIHDPSQTVPLARKL